MTHRARFVSIVIAGLAVGCFSGSETKPAPKRPPTAYEEFEQRMPAVLAAMTKLGEQLQAADGDCPKMAAALRAFGLEYATQLEEFEKLDKRLTEKERERYQHEHAEDGERVIALFKALDACNGDPEVEAASEMAGFRKKKVRPRRAE